VGQLLGFREGDRDALGAVYREHVAALVVFLERGFSFDSRGRALRFAGFRSSFELHDAVQETFRRAFERDARLSYDGLRPFGAWLITIARNVVLKEFRRHERLFVDEAGADALSAELHPAHSATTDPEAELHQTRVRELVRQFLDTLTQDERRLLELRFVEDVGQRDAADELALGRQRLRTREGKLREKLLRFLTAHGQGDPRRGPPSAAGMLVWGTSARQLSELLDAWWFEACAMAASPSVRELR
jgi:RNA polymerase sigma-70 factor (ECF subfamily)